MNMVWRKTVAAMLMAIACVFFSSHVMAGQASSYTETNLGDGECEQYAYDIALKAGYVNIDVNNPIVTFNSGPYQCAARCILKHNIVFFYCVGPESGYAHEVVEFMKKTGAWVR